MDHLPPQVASDAVRLDLGCGRAKVPEFIGVDRFHLPGVDVVADLEARLPFADDSVDLVYASHSLEHVRDLSSVIREISRICKHGARLCIVAPYHAQGLNHANPYHFHAFNEHTPRFWTASTTTGIDPAEYYHPHAGAWGLLESDHSSPDIDLRCVKMEFFYFPEYRELPEQEQRRHRKHEQDVCDQIVYHLLVLKLPLSDEEFFNMARDTETYESPYLALRRLQEYCERLEASQQETVVYARQLEVGLQELEHYKERLESDFQEVTRYKDRLEAAYGEVVCARDKLEADYHEALRHTQKQHEEIAGEAQRLRVNLAQLQQDCEALEHERASLSETLRWLEIVRAEQERQLTAITAAPGWKLLQSVRRLRTRLAPPHSWHGRLVRSMHGTLQRWASRLASPGQPANLK